MPLLLMMILRAPPLLALPAALAVRAGWCLDDDVDGDEEDEEDEEDKEEDPASLKSPRARRRDANGVGGCRTTCWVGEC